MPTGRKILRAGSFNDKFNGSSLMLPTSPKKGKLLEAASPTKSRFQHAEESLSEIAEGSINLSEISDNSPVTEKKSPLPYS